MTDTGSSLCPVCHLVAPELFAQVGAPDLVQEDVRQHQVSPGHQQPLALLSQLVTEVRDLEPHQPRVVRDVVKHRDGGRVVYEQASRRDGGERRSETRLEIRF